MRTLNRLLLPRQGQATRIGQIDQSIRLRSLDGLRPEGATHDGRG